ncbi:MAG: hypothetical protein NUV98_01180 [Candidatus Roizmanbacteria bacterium]|nr:hypothetical protein [Candidatus Roizmanbacteria bacterium]
MLEAPLIIGFPNYPLWCVKTELHDRFEIRDCTTPCEFKQCLSMFDPGRGIFYETLNVLQKNVCDEEDHDLSRYRIHPFSFSPGFNQLNELSWQREMLASSPYGFRLTDLSNGSEAIVSFQWFPGEEAVEEFYNTHPYNNLSRSSGIKGGDIFIDQIQGYAAWKNRVVQPFFKQLLWPELLTTYAAHFAYCGGLEKIYYLPRELTEPTRYRESSSSDWIYRQVPTRLGFKQSGADNKVLPYVYEFPQE